MGIKRCPYCRALISEEDQYCRNCGTQLLFPEDENIEEEIPGEKILEEPEEETSTHNGEIYLDEEAEEAQEEEVEESEKITGEWEELDEEESGLSSEAEEEEVIVVEEENLKPSPPEDERDDFLKEKKVSQQKTPAELLFADDKTPLLFPEEELAEAEKTKPEETEGKEIKDEEYSLTEKIEELEKEAFSEIEEEEPGLFFQFPDNFRYHTRAHWRNRFFFYFCLSFSFYFTLQTFHVHGHKPGFRPSFRAWFLFLSLRKSLFFQLFNFFCETIFFIFYFFS